MDPFQQTRKRIAPGYGMSPRDLMGRQRYYEAEGYPYEMSEFFNDEASSELGEERPCMGKEHDIIAQIKKTPLPMARKKRARELGYLCMGAQHQQTGVGRTIKRAGIKLKLKLHQLGVDLVGWLSWILGHFRIINIIDSLGSASASYFKLLRHLWLLNTLLFLLIFGFICIPQLVHMSEATQTPPGYNDTITLLVDGRGEDLEFSILFIGYYYGNTTSVLGHSYMLPVVYLVVMFWALVISLLWMLCSSKGLALAGKVQLQESSPFTRRVFASWDFNLHHQSTIQEQQAVITAELKDLTARATSQFHKSHWYCCVYLVRFIISCCVCIVILGGGAAIFFTVQTLKSGTCGIHYLHEPLTSYQSLNFLLSFRVALVMVALNTTFPWIIALLMKMELYGSHETVLVKSIRTFSMYVLSFGVLVYSLLALSEECKCQTSGYCCWETRVGQELYRLFWLDFFLEVAEVMILDFVRGLIVRYQLMCTLSDWIGYREFDLPKRTLDLMYTQALVWFGMFFCPQLPVMAALRYLSMYFLRSWATRLANLPPSHLCFSRANVAYYSSVMLGTLLALMVPLGWTVTQGLSHMTQVIEGPLDAWSAAEGHLGRLGLLVQGLRSSAVVLPCVFFLCLVVVYYYNKVKAIRRTRKDLLIQLDAECRVSHERLITAVSLIPPCDAAFYEDEIVGRYNEIMQHNTIHPVQYMGNSSNQRPFEAHANDQDSVFYYDEEAHVPRQVFIAEDVNEPLP